MNSKNIVPRTERILCDKCLAKESSITYKVKGRGYGSNFDTLDFDVQLCADCDRPEYEEWFNEKPELTGEYAEEEYKHDRDILDLVDSIPIESQECMFNNFMDSQDWIDLQLAEFDIDKLFEEKPESKVVTLLKAVGITLGLMCVLALLAIGAFFILPMCLALFGAGWVAIGLACIIFAAISYTMYKSMRE